MAADTQLEERAAGPEHAADPAHGTAAADPAYAIGGGALNAHVPEVSCGALEMPGGPRRPPVDENGTPYYKYTCGAPMTDVGEAAMRVYTIIGEDIWGKIWTGGTRVDSGADIPCGSAGAVGRIQQERGIEIWPAPFRTHALTPIGDGGSIDLVDSILIPSAFRTRGERIPRNS